MNLQALLNAIFEDRDWIMKLVVTGAVTLFAIVFTPVLIGLAGWALLFGYMNELAGNVRAGERHPLPRWDSRYSRFWLPGASILIAFLIYNVPNLFLGCGWFFILSVSNGAQIVGGTVMIASVCCLLPIILIYNLFMLPFFAVGLARFNELPQLATFFSFGLIYEEIGRHLNETVQYLIVLIGALVVLALLWLVPVVGWAIYAGLIVPVAGILIGQYAILVLGKRTPPARPAAPAAPPRRSR